MAREITTFRDLFAGRGSEFEGREVKPLRYPRNVPIMLSAFGPKAVKLAGEIADGVILFSGAKQLDKLAQQIALFRDAARSEEHTSELQSLMRISYAVFCLKKKTDTTHKHTDSNETNVHNTNKSSNINT